MATKQKQGGVWRASLTVLLCTAMFFGCEVSNNDEKEKKVTDFCELRIKQDFQEQFGRPLTHFNYFGTHNGFVAFLVIYPELLYPGPAKIAGTIFRGFTTPWVMYFWKDGYPITGMIQAHLQGLITPENIAEIGSRIREPIRKAWPGCDESFNEWWFNTDDIDFIIE